MKLLDITEEQVFTRSRWARFTRYLVFTVAGLLLVIYPLRAVLEAVTTLTAYAGGALLLLGGLLSAAGAAMDRWSGEALGCPLLFMAFWMFGGVLTLTGSTLAGVATGLIFLGVGLGVVDRWLTAMHMLRLAKRAVGDGR